MACKSSKQGTLAQMKQPSGKRTLDIAIVGDSGVGKSSLVNALRNMADDELGAAAVDVIKGTREPMGYFYPQYPDVTLWDLPGIQPPLFPAERYIKDMDFKKYDFFILVGERRLTDDAIVLARKIQKTNKGFFYVCTKVDVIIFAESRKPSFNEEKTLEQIRKDCCECLTKAGESPPRVFLISRWDLSMYDFPLLQRTLQDECIDLQRRALLPPQDPGRKIHNKSSDSSRRASWHDFKKNFLADLENMKAVLVQGHLPDVVAQIRQELDLLSNATLDIAITGHTGAGKSSLVNALRGMSDFGEGSAKTGLKQTTMFATKYQHPKFPKVTLWDLPGIGTDDFKADEYLEKVDFSKYDFFIIASERFTESDTQLAREIQKMKKKFYYVHPKINLSMDAERRRPTFNEMETLEDLRQYYCDKLRKLGEASPKVFLISNWDLSMYDFPILQETLQNELDHLKRHALLLSMPTFSRDILEKKKSEMRKLIWKQALVSSYFGCVTRLALKLPWHIFFLVKTLKKFCMSFGLDEESLCSLANRVGKPLSELKSVIKKSPLANEISEEFVLDLLAKSGQCKAPTVLGQIVEFIPVLGNLVSGTISFQTIYHMLQCFLQDVEEDAENVRAKASER
uniref:IRG-type G domain-containing protein n=1 Tax=Podarcis muralis TaxID=64176 RepID=A0A670IGT1_PODMU